MARKGGSYVINASGQPVLRERTGAVLSRPKPRKPVKDTMKTPHNKATPEADRDADT